MGTQLSDAELLEAWRRGDAAAGNQLLDRHFARVYGFFARRVSEGIEDLVQDTFVACVEKRHAIRDGASFRAFLLGSARNELLMELRRRGQAGSRAERMEHEPLPTQTSPSRLAAAHEEERLLLAALRELSADLQVTLELHYWERLTTAEIGDVLGIAPGTVKWRLSDARERLRDILQKQGAPAKLAEATARNLDAWARSVRRLLGNDDDPQSPPTRSD